MGTKGIERNASTSLKVTGSGGRSYRDRIYRVARRIVRTGKTEKGAGVMRRVQQAGGRLSPRARMEAALAALAAEFEHGNPYWPYKPWGRQVRVQKAAARLIARKGAAVGTKEHKSILTKGQRIMDRVRRHEKMRPRAKMSAVLGALAAEFAGGRWPGGGGIPREPKRRVLALIGRADSRLRKHVAESGYHRQGLPRGSKDRARATVLTGRLRKLKQIARARGFASVSHPALLAALGRMEAAFASGKRWTELRGHAAAVAKVIRHGGGGKRLRPKARWGTAPSDIRNERARTAISGVVSGLWSRHAKTRGQHIKAARALAKPYPKRAS